MLLPEDPIIRILLLHLEDRHGMAASRWYAGLRRVCAMFRRICNSPEVLRRLQLWGIRQYLRRWPGDSWTRFEDRMLLAGNRKAICIAGMQMMMEWRELVGRQALVNQATVAGDSCAAYFLAMLWYRRNHADPEALVVLQTISGGPS